MVENSNPIIVEIIVIELANPALKPISSPIEMDKNNNESNLTSQNILIFFESIRSIPINPSLTNFIASILFCPECVVFLTILLNFIVSF